MSLGPHSSRHSADVDYDVEIVTGFDHDIIIDVNGIGPQGPPGPQGPAGPPGDGLVVTPGPTPPDGPNIGDIWIDGDGNLWVWDGTAWVAVGARKYAATVGDGVLTTIPVTHNLGTGDVHVTLRASANPSLLAMCDVEVVDPNTVNLIFATPPAAGAYRVVIS